ncbi:UNVERIFIED_CONTAM: hypothetical protein K2H54_031410 [Gekko kuhli]
MASPARAEASATSLLAPLTIPKLRSPSCSSRRERQSDSDFSESLKQDNHLRSVDLYHVIKLLEETESVSIAIVYKNIQKDGEENAK